MKLHTLISLIFLCYSSIIFAQNEGTEEDKTDEVYTLVEEMPRFPGCEDLEGTVQEKKSCADQKFMTFIYTNIKYPLEARLKGKEGMAVVSFIVTEEGTIRAIEIVRDPGYGMGVETIRVVEMMNDRTEKWTPGKQRGKAVPVKYNMPLRFSL